MRGINREMNPFGKYGDLLRRPNGRPTGTQGIPQMQPRLAGRGTMQMGGGDPEAMRRAKAAAMAGRPPGEGMPGGIERMGMPGGMPPPQTIGGGVMPGMRIPGGRGLSPVEFSPENPDMRQPRFDPGTTLESVGGSIGYQGNRNIGLPPGFQPPVQNAPSLEQFKAQQDLQRQQQATNQMPLRQPNMPGGGLGMGGTPRMMGMQPQMQDMMRRRGFGGRQW